VRESLGLLAVQYPAQHRLGNGPEDWWQIVILLGGVALLCRGLIPVVRALRWRTHALSPRDRGSTPGEAISWSLILGLVVVGSFLAITSA
jgi:hypothetical protein